MKLVISILMAILFFTDLSAQKLIQKGNIDYSKKVAVSGRKDIGRYEILVFSTTAIKLDVFTGETYYSDYGFYRSETSKRWNLIKVAGGFPDESSSVKSKYRVYGQATHQAGIDFFYLLNTETGQTWISDTAFQYWHPLPDKK